MTAVENEHNLNPVDGLHHVEHLASVNDRVVRKKDKRRKGRHGHDRYTPASDSDSADGSDTEDSYSDDDGQDHLDFCA